MPDIQSIDPRHAPRPVENGVRFYDPRYAPFSIHGLLNPLEVGAYRRLPVPIAEMTNDGVAWLSRHSAGGRIRFATDASSLTLRVTVAPHGCMPHCTPMMENGFDLYMDTPRASRYVDEFKFDPARDDYAVTVALPAGDKELTLNMPLYGEVCSVEIGMPEAARVWAHAPYTHATPIVYYGSSITQGACASRPGLSYQAILSRLFDCDYTNLGFSGSARGEDAIASYMASLPMAAFVSDYDHNAPSPDHLRATHHNIYKTIRASHPDIPYIMVSKPDFLWREDDIARRDIIMESYLAARATGDRHVYFLDGASFFVPSAPGESRADFTADNCHPLDTGFRRMATAMADVIEAALGW